MNFRRRQPVDEPEINLIPLIDVLLVILIFLAATTSFARYHQFKVALPQAQADAPEVQSLTIAISQEGLYALDNELLNSTDVSALAAALRQATTGVERPTLTINADGKAAHEAVVRVMEAAREAGIERINFATQSPA